MSELPLGFNFSLKKFIFICPLCINCVFIVQTNMSMEKSFHIANLIVAFIQGEVSEEDLVVLDRWLDEAEENRALFVSFMDETLFEKQKEQHSNQELDTIFFRIKMRKQQQEKQIRYKRRFRLVGSVAAVIAVVFSVLLMFQRLGDKPEITAGGEITVGRQMAYLLLSSGEKIVLDEHHCDTITTKETHQQIIFDQGRVEIEQPLADSIGKEVFHVMEVPRGAEYNLTLADGTRVWMNAASKLKFPAHFNSTRRYVELVGEAYFEVTHDDTRPFIVHTDNVDVRVLGTEFCVRNYIDKPTLTTLIKGSVEITDYTGRQAVLKPGQQSVTDKGYTRIREVETIYYTAWKDGYFIFEDTPLEQIMEELSLWYNCEYFFQNHAAAHLCMTARLKKYNNIDVILDILCKTKEVQIEKKGNTIVVKKR